MSQPKGMSSRLLTMKFMQRAAASGTNSSPTQSPPDSPSSKKRADDTSSPVSKRQKTTGDSPSQRIVSRSNGSDIEAIEAAIEAENSKRSAAIARQAADAGETQWVLEYPPGTIKTAASRKSINIVENEESKEDEAAYGGRRSYGGFKKKRQIDEPPKAPKPDTNAGKDAKGVNPNRSAKTGKISSGGGTNNSNKGKNYKNRQ